MGSTRCLVRELGAGILAWDGSVEDRSWLALWSGNVMLLWIAN
jgi:hypothetical protein